MGDHRTLPEILRDAATTGRRRRLVMSSELLDLCERAATELEDAEDVKNRYGKLCEAHRELRGVISIHTMETIHISALGGENTMCGILFEPSIKRVRDREGATCKDCLSIDDAAEEASRAFSRDHPVVRAIDAFHVQRWV